MENQKIRIIKKNNDFSLEYKPGDIFTVDSTWYGGVNVTSKSGIPLSLDREEYELYQEAEEPRRGGRSKEAGHEPSLRHKGGAGLIFAGGETDL